MHPLLKCQLREIFADSVPDDPRLAALIQSVEEAYGTAETDRRQLENSLRQAASELLAHNRRLEKDLEDRKRLEVELYLAEKLRAMGQLAGGVAHEINTPIQFIADSLHFLYEAFAEVQQLLAAYERLSAVAPSDPQYAQLLHEIRELRDGMDMSYLSAEIPRALTRCDDGTRRVSKIVCALKDLADPGASEQEPANLVSVIENTLIVVANEIKHVANVELDLAATRPVRCHSGEIHQVLLNLIVNAGHAIGERVGDSGGKGTISIATRDESEEFVITIEDDGGGMPEHVRERIFEPFFTTKPVGKGTGHGLPLARSLIVDRHGGQLTFDSTPGKGTTFTVRLPVNGKPMAA